MTSGVIFGLLSALCTGLSLVLVKKSYEEFPPSIAFAFQALFGVLIWIPFALYTGVEFTTLLWLVFPLALLSAILSEAFYYFIFSKADVGLTTTVFSVYPIFTVGVSLLLLGEQPPTDILWFVGVIVLGIIVLSWPDKNIGKISNKHKAVIWGLIGAFAVGFSDALSKGVIDETSAATFLFALAIMQVPVALVFLKHQKESFSQFVAIFTQIRKYGYSMAGALLGVTAVLLLWLAFEATYASVASPLTASFPLFTIILAYFWLREKLTLRDGLGVLITIVGIIGISTF